MTSTTRLLLSTLTGMLWLLSLGGCSPVRPDPVAVVCPKVQVSPELLQPAQTVAMQKLLDYLQTQSLNAAGTPSIKTP